MWLLWVITKSTCLVYGIWDFGLCHGSQIIKCSNHGAILPFCSCGSLSGSFWRIESGTASVWWVLVCVSFPTGIPTISKHLFMMWSCVNLNLLPDNFQSWLLNNLWRHCHLSGQNLVEATWQDYQFIACWAKWLLCHPHIKPNHLFFDKNTDQPLTAWTLC